MRRQFKFSLMVGPTRTIVSTPMTRINEILEALKSGHRVNFAYYTAVWDEVTKCGSLHNRLNRTQMRDKTLQGWDKFAEVVKYLSSDEFYIVEIK